MQRQKMTYAKFSTVAAATLVVIVLLTVGPVFSQASGLNVTVSQQKVDTNNEGVTQDLLVKVKVHLACPGQNGVTGTLVVTSQLYDPSGAQVGSASTTDSNPSCGVNGYTFTMLDVLLSSGMYTITTTATLGSLSATDSHTFDPHVEGSMGPM